MRGGKKSVLSWRGEGRNRPPGSHKPYPDRDTNWKVPNRQELYPYLDQGRRLRVASGATAPGLALEGAPRFRPMSLSSYILR